VISQCNTIKPLASIRGHIVVQVLKYWPVCHWTQKRNNKQ